MRGKWQRNAVKAIGWTSSQMNNKAWAPVAHGLGAWWFETLDGEWVCVEDALNVFIENGPNIVLPTFPLRPQRQRA